MLKLGSLLFVAAISASAASLQHPLSQTDKSTQTTQPDQRGTPKTPFIVDFANTPEAKARAQADSSYQQGEATNNTRVMIFTGLLVAVGFIQFLAMMVQAYWMRRTVRISEKAADAAKESADAVVSQLRAYLHVSIEKAPIIEADRSIRPIVSVKNTGQTPAYDTQIVSNVGVISWPPPRPREDIYVETKPLTNVKITIQPGEAAVNIPEMFNVSPLEERGLKAKAVRMVVWGQVKYVDAFKKPRITKYAFSFGWEKDGFGPYFYEPVGNSSD